MLESANVDFLLAAKLFDLMTVYFLKNRKIVGGQVGRLLSQVSRVRIPSSVKINYTESVFLMYFYKF